MEVRSSSIRSSAREGRCRSFAGPTPTRLANKGGHMRITIKTIGIPAFIAIALGFAITEPSHGQDIVYQPINPRFGGNPFNSAHLLGVASAQNKYNDPNGINSQDPGSQLTRTLQSRLLPSLQTQHTDATDDVNAQQTGTNQTR